eukprot:1180766-Prorocentrum_minimum.AAC.3
MDQSDAGNAAWTNQTQEAQHGPIRHRKRRMDQSDTGSAGWTNLRGVPVGIATVEAVLVVEINAPLKRQLRRGGPLQKLRSPGRMRANKGE